MSIKLYYCHGCGQTFTRDDGQTQCPSCGSMETEHTASVKGDEDEYSALPRWTRNEGNNGFVWSG